MAKKDVSCKYNQECWLKVRLPIIRKNKGVYLPYQCSFVTMGDMEKCSLRDRFAREHNDVIGVEARNDSLSTERISTDNLQ